MEVKMLLGIIGAFGSIGAKIGECLMAPVGRHFCYLYSYKSKLENLKKEVEKLDEKRGAVQKSVDEAERNVKAIGDDVKGWQARVDKCSKEARGILEGEIEANKGCLFGWCPNLKLRYSLGKKATKNLGEVAELYRDQENFRKVAYTEPLPGIEFTPIQGIKDFKSRRLIMNDVMEALKDDRFHMIGICGMGGVGKTTMVKEVANRAKGEKLFDEVVMAVVSQSPDERKIQGEIADKLGLSFVEETVSGRANRLHESLRRAEKILVILDDVWKHLELNDIGIPFGDGHKGCKILLTSRYDYVCHDMGAQQKFTVPVLKDEEAWDLFKEMAGISNDTSHTSTDLLSTQIAVANECGGLPIAIVTVGRALKDKDRYSWNSAVEQLQNSIIKNIRGVDEKVFKSLELSYNSLKSTEAKNCFLLCSLYPEDFNIPIEDLVRYGFGLELFESTHIVCQARERVLDILDDLKKCYLLMDSESEEFVKMHDVIRDVAISIASREEHSFMVRCDKVVKDWPEKDRLKNYAVISLKLNAMHGLPGNLEFPNLQLLRLDCNARLTPITYFSERMEEVKVQENQDNFYQGMKEVKVLALSHMCGSLPTSLRCLAKLRTLSLFNCRLIDGDISMIGALENMEILSFADSYIKELPKEIVGHFAHLKVLDLLGCIVERIFPGGFLSSLSKLEELYVGSIFQRWCEVEESKESAKVIINELASLSNLVALDIALIDINFWPRGLVIEKVKKFNIVVGRSFHDIHSPCYPLSNQLELQVDNVGDVIETRLNSLLKSTEILTLGIRKGLKILCDLVNGDVFGHLTKLTLEKCDDLEYLINTADGVPQSASPVLEDAYLSNIQNFKGINSHECRLPNKVFNALKNLSLEYLPKLTNLWKGPTQLVWLGNLRYVNVWDCDKLECMFSLSIARDLVQLQELEIGDCRMMEVIVSSEGGGGGEHEIAIATDKIEFPKLERLFLRNLPNFTAICKAMNAIELPQLSVLDLQNIPKLKSLCLASDSDSDSHAIIQPLFNNKVKLPSIETLYVSGMEDLMEVWPLDLQAKLREMTVEMCHGLSNVLFPSDSIKGMQNLEILTVEECRSVRVAFDFEGLAVQEGISDTAFPSLKRVELRCLPKLTHVWKENSLGIQGFQNLRSLFVKGCGSLRNLFSYSLAKLLVKLEEIKVTKCGAMEAIIANEPKTDGVITNTIMFPQLNYFVLSDLPNLTSFCCQTYTFEESLLNIVKVINCPKMKALQIAFQHKLEQETSNVGLNEAVQKADFSTSAQHHLLDGKFILSNEGNLTLTGIDEPINIPQSQLEVECLHEVRFMLVQCCENISGVVSSNLIQGLKNLEKLKVWLCDSLEVIFDIQEGVYVVEEGTSISQINELELKYLPKLTHIWKNIPQQTQCFQNLTSLIVARCDSLKYIFTFSMAKVLVSLKELSIQHCERVEKIVTRETGEEEEERGETFLPVLHRVRVRDLPSLVCFGLEVYDTTLPNDDYMEVSFCPNFVELGFKKTRREG